LVEEGIFLEEVAEAESADGSQSDAEEEVVEELEGDPCDR
jgi:hypothetical protein